MLLYAMTIKNLILCYEIPMLMYKISMLLFVIWMLCYAMAYVEKDAWTDCRWDKTMKENAKSY